MPSQKREGFGSDTADLAATVERIDNLDGDRGRLEKRMDEAINTGDVAGYTKAKVKFEEVSDEIKGLLPVAQRQWDAYYNSAGEVQDGTS